MNKSYKVASYSDVNIGADLVGKFLALKNRRGEHVSNLPTDPMELVELGVCSVKSIDYMNGQCDECPGKGVVINICKELEKVKSLSYY